MPFKVVVHGGEHNAGSCKRKQSSTKGRKSTKRKKSTMKSQLQTQSTTKKMEKKKNQLKPSSPKKVLGESENICHYSADCPYVPAPEVLEYSKVVQESEGFTSIPATGKLADRICGGIRPTGVNGLVKEAARFAVAQQNKKGKNITVEKIVKANRQLVGYSVYYMTLKTLVGDGADPRTVVFYEAKVFRHMITNRFRLAIFREAKHYNPKDAYMKYYADESYKESSQSDMLMVEQQPEVIFI